MRRWIIASLVPLMASCDDRPAEPPGTPGALKEGGFVFCDDALDCSGDGTVPDHIAVGTTFVMSYGDGVHDVTLSSSDPAVLEGKTLTIATALGPGEILAFRGLKAGAVSIEAKAGGSLVDFVRLDLEDTSSLDLGQCTRRSNAITPSDRSFGPSSCSPQRGVTGIEVSLGSSLAPTVCATPVDGSGNALAGRIPVDWSVAEGATAEIEIFVAEDRRCATVGGLTVGTATIAATSNGTSATFDMTVKP